METLNPKQLLSQSDGLAPSDLPFLELESPAEVLDLRYLEDNLRYLKTLGEAANVRVLFAQKAYSLFTTYPLISKYLWGTCSSGLYEAKLAHEEMPTGELHVFSPAYKQSELEEVLTFADVVLFNSPSEWNRWRDLALKAKSERTEKSLSLGLRVNPEYSEIEEEIYNPAAKGSRLGMTVKELEKALGQNPDFLEGIDGLHFHSLCEEGAEELENVLKAFEAKFAPYIPNLKWLNFGGGHHFTRRDYNVPLFLELMKYFHEKYNVTLYVEPGEAVPLDCGWLVSRVLDTGYNEMHFAILDTSASCHMPDVIEMPYRPRAFRVRTDGSFERAGDPSEFEFTYRLGGPTCLAGDIIGDYSFRTKLERDDMLVFCDMAIYSHVKRNSFNGMPLPNLHIWDGKQFKNIRTFNYCDFKTKLGEVDV